MMWRNEQLVFLGFCGTVALARIMFAYHPAWFTVQETASQRMKREDLGRYKTVTSFTVTPTATPRECAMEVVYPDDFMRADRGCRERVIYGRDTDGSDYSRMEMACARNHVAIRLSNGELITYPTDSELPPMCATPSPTVTPTVEGPSWIQTAAMVKHTPTPMPLECRSYGQAASNGSPE
jgi:hypothetical protein